MSQVSGEVLRSVKSSPPWSMYATTTTAAAPPSQSHHMTRWRKRRASGNRRNDRSITKATWIARSAWVGTIEYAAYRWNSDIATASAATAAPRAPPSRLAAPSSSST